MKEVILLLDDEDNIRRDLGKFLQKSGYGVHKASSVEEARKIVLSEEIDCAIVDLKIDYETEFGGIQVVNFVKRIRPKAKAIVLSAYSLDDNIRSKFEVEIDGYIAKGGQENYILSVLLMLEELERKPELKTCFVIMPISNTTSCNEDEWTEIFEELIKPAVEESGYDYQCKRAQSFYGNIIKSIIDGLNRSDIVIADLTDKNPNVFYELGVRHTLRGSTMLISQSIDDVPSDLKSYATIIYKWKRSEDRKKFKDRIKDIIHLIETDPEKGSSPIRDYLNP